MAPRGARQALVLQRFQLLRELREQLAMFRAAGLGWEQAIAAVRGGLNLAAKLGIDVPHAEELLELLAIAERFAALGKERHEAAMRARLGLTILAARHLARLTATSEDDELVEVVAHFAEDDRIENILVYVLSQVWADEQAPAAVRLLSAPRDYTERIAWAERQGLLRGNGLKRLREALPQLIELFNSLVKLADLFGAPKLAPVP